MAPIARPRGTRDFGPDETEARKVVERRMRDAFERAGFHEVQTPTFEHLELFTAKSGEAVIGELYDFTDKGDRALALRPELTAPVMRYYHDALAVAPKPVRLYYFANCFRYDRPQKGRYREFWQMGCELIGADTPEATAEVLALGAALLHGAGVQDLVVRVGHLKILDGALDAIGWPADGDRTALLRLVDKWDESAVHKALDDAGVEPGARDWFLALHEATDLDALASALAAAPAEEAREELARAHGELTEVVAAAADLGMPMRSVQVDALIARGLDYYTGVVFEMDAPALGAEKQLLGGGTYDLSGVFGSEPVATCGFGLGFDRTLVALEAEGNESAAALPLHVYVAPIGDEARPEALRLTQALRSAGLRTEVDLMRRNPGKNLKAANTRQARFAVVLGARELAGGVASVKDLASGEQEAIALDLLAATLADRVGA